jgi:hypothetical protein
MSSSSRIEKYEVTIPRNTYPGDCLVIKVGDPAREYEVVVPEGCSPGSLLSVEVPIDEAPQQRQQQPSYEEQYNKRRTPVREAPQQQQRRRQQQQQQRAPLPWVDVCLIAEDSAAVGAWANIDLLEAGGAAGAAPVRITDKPAWEQIKNPGGTIRVAATSPPSSSTVIVRVQGDMLETTSAAASVGTKIYLRVLSRQAGRGGTAEPTTGIAAGGKAEEAAAAAAAAAGLERRSAGGAGFVSGNGALASDAPKLSRRYSVESDKRIEKLMLLTDKVDTIEHKFNGFRQAVSDGTASAAQLSTIQDALAQEYGHLEKLQFNEIDAVITGDLTTGKDDARQMRKALSKRTGRMLSELEKLVGEVKRKRGKA